MAEARANSSLGGYDEHFVDVVEDEWNCPICQLPLKEAVQTGVCGHRFCRQCLDGHFMRLALLNYVIRLDCCGKKAFVRGRKIVGTIHLRYK